MCRGRKSNWTAEALLLVDCQLHDAEREPANLSDARMRPHLGDRSGAALGQRLHGAIVAAHELLHDAERKNALAFADLLDGVDRGDHRVGMNLASIVCQELRLPLPRFRQPRSTDRWPISLRELGSLCLLGNTLHVPGHGPALGLHTNNLPWIVCANTGGGLWRCREGSLGS
jgi:hypothetical protein